MNKLAPFEEIKLVTRKQLSNPTNIQNSFMVTKWLSVSYNNTTVCSKADYFRRKGVSIETINALLYYGNKGGFGFTTKNKENDPLKDHLKKFYKFSEREYQIQKHLIVVDNILINELALKLGLNKKECKKIGANWVKPKKEKLKKADLKPQVKGLGSYN